MNTLIMLFALPIGIVWRFYEKKAMRRYEAIFEEFYDKVRHDETLDPKAKRELLEEMLYQNRYSVTHPNPSCVRGEKKIFSIGWMFIGIGTFYIGLILYVLWFFYFQKPHTVTFCI